MCFKTIPELRLRKATAIAVKMKTKLLRRLKDGGDTRVIGYFKEELQARYRTIPRDRSMLQSAKLEVVGDLKSTLISNMDIQNFEFPLLFLFLLCVIVC